MITVGFRKIGSGTVATGGEQVVLHASADDGNANILFPAEEIPRLLVLLIQLLGDARRERFKSGSVEAHSFDLKSLEYEVQPHEGREILRAVIGRTGDEAIFLSFLKGELAPMISDILETMEHVASQPPGRQAH